MLKINDATVVVTRKQATLFKGRTLGHVRRDDDYLIVNFKRSRSGKYDDNFYHISDVIAYVEGKGGDDDSGAFALVMADARIHVSIGRVTSMRGELHVRSKAGAVIILPESASANDARISIQRETGRPAVNGGKVDDRPSADYIDKTKF